MDTWKFHAYLQNVFDEIITESSEGMGESNCNQEYEEVHVAPRECADDVVVLSHNDKEWIPGHSVKDVSEVTHEKGLSETRIVWGTLKQIQKT